jgi:hypothetical protein
MSGSALASSGAARSFWVRWVVASAVGVVVATGGFIAVYSVIGEPGDVLFPILMAGVGGVVGAFQQRVLRRVLGDAGGWALATGVGIGVGIGLAVATEPESSTLVTDMLEGLVSGAAVGAIVGTPQWRVVRAGMPGARWWVPASIGGWALAASVAVAADYYVDGLGIAVFSLVAAAATGVPLALLLRPHTRARTSTGQVGTGVVTNHAGTASPAE